MNSIVCSYVQLVCCIVYEASVQDYMVRQHCCYMYVQTKFLYKIVYYTLEELIIRYDTISLRYDIIQDYTCAQTMTLWQTLTMSKDTSQLTLHYITLHYITLHQSYLEWPKYKTVKPLQYTGYRTRNGKQLGMIGRKGKF